VMTPLTGVAAGTSQSFTVTAYDAFGNVSTVYTGTVLVSTTDAAGSFYYAFTPADAGVHTFSIALRTAGSQTLTVADYASRAVSAGQRGIVAPAGAAASISVTPLHATTAGMGKTVTVTARDAYGNIATGYTGTVHFASSDTQAGLPADYTFTAADAGTHAF